MKNILFPQWCRSLGWWLFAIGLIAVAVSWLVKIAFYNEGVIGVTLGAMLIVCSKERNEDEMTRAVRLSSLLNALYACVVVIVTGALLTADIAQLTDINLVLFPTIYVIICRADMWRIYKMTKDEKQD